MPSLGVPPGALGRPRVRHGNYIYGDQSLMTIHDLEQVSKLYQVLMQSYEALHTHAQATPATPALKMLVARHSAALLLVREILNRARFDNEWPDTLADN